MHVVCEYNNISVSGEFVWRMTTIIIIIIMVISLREHGQYCNDAGDGWRRSRAEGCSAYRRIPRVRTIITGREESRRSNVRPRRRPADPQPPPPHRPRTDRVRRAISLPAAAANRSFSYTNPERSRNRLSALLYYYYYYRYTRMREARAVRLEAIL